MQPPAHADGGTVVVADPSVFVSSSSYGPTLTLVALAARAAALAGPELAPTEPMFS